MTAPPVDRKRQFLSLGGALILASALGLLLIALVARWLTPAQNVLFLSLWGLVFGFGSVLASTEQEIARQATVARLEGRRAPVSVLQWAGAGLVGTAVVLAVLAMVGFDTTFAGSWPLVALTAVALVGFAVQFLARGVFLGGGDTRSYVAVIVLEAAVRIVPILVLWLLDVPPSVVLAVAAVVLGCWGWLAVVPRLVAVVDSRSARQRWRDVIGRLATLAGANGLSSLVLTAFPTLVVVLLGRSPDLALLFGVITLSRVPLVLVSPLQAMVVPIAVEYLHAGRGRALASLQAKGAALILVAAAVLAAGAWLLGPWAVRVFLGPQYEEAPAVLPAVTFAASAVMAGALLQAAVFIALERYPLVTLTWGLAVAAAVVAMVVAHGGPADRALAGFVAATVVGYLASGGLLRVSLRRYRGDQAPRAQGAGDARPEAPPPR